MAGLLSGWTQMQEMTADVQGKVQGKGRREVPLMIWCLGQLAGSRRTRCWKTEGPAMLGHGRTGRSSTLCGPRSGCAKDACLLSRYRSWYADQRLTTPPFSFRAAVTKRHSSSNSLQRPKAARASEWCKASHLYFPIQRGAIDNDRGLAVVVDYDA